MRDLKTSSKNIGKISNANKVIARIKKSEHVLIITHESPDGDALGSMLGLSVGLKMLNKKVKLVCASKIPLPFNFLPQINDIKHDFLLGDHDLIIILDCGDLKRTGYPERLKEFSKNKKKIINIDHHPKNDLHRIVSLNYIDYFASSTAEIIYNLISTMNLPINKDIATCLLCGLYTDTGAFKHANTSERVLQIASVLLKSGANLKKITKNITNGKSIAALKLWGIVFSRIKRNEELGLVSSFVTAKDIKDCQAEYHDLAGAVNMINSIPGTRAAILFSETEDDKIKASIRTESDKVDVSRFARFFGGGGIKKAAGFTIKGRLVFKNDRWNIE